jgi:RNA polymerase sigma-B factor
MDPRTTHADGVRTLLRRWHEAGDNDAREELVGAMLPLARSLARRYVNRGEPLDDLEQVACLGLLKAIDGFDVRREVRFTSYAVPTIAGELKRHFRDRGWMMRVPRDVQELHARLAPARERLRAKLGRQPTAQELAVALGVPESRVDEALRAGDAYRTLSLDEPQRDGGGAFEVIGGADDNYERAEARAMLAGGLRRLPDREREIMRLRFYEGRTQREIADELGLSQMHVSRLIRKCVDQLRERLEVAQAA